MANPLGFFAKELVPSAWLTELTVPAGWFSTGFVDVDSGPPPTGNGHIKFWNTTAWTSKPVKYWNGTSWVTKPLKRWNGTSWSLTP